MNKPNVVLGEASESEDEEKIVLSVAPKSDSSPLRLVSKGVIVPGEASESDSDTEGTHFREAFIAKNGATENEVYEETHNSTQYDTLLHRKLRECNLSLHNNIQRECHQPIENAAKALNQINQQLLVTQLQVQDAASALRKAFTNLSKLGESLNTALATPYIPDINVP